MAFDKDAIIASLKEASISDLNDLVKAIEEEFDVSAAAPVAVAGAAGGGTVWRGIGHGGRCRQARAELL